MEKDQYLQYFSNNKKLTSKTLYSTHLENKKISDNGSKKDKKILPHISQEYEFKITNHLLLQKIINPKRDKTIIQNFGRRHSRDCSSRSRLKQTAMLIYHKTKTYDKIKSVDRDCPAKQDLNNNIFNNIRSRKMFNLQKVKQIQKQAKNYEIIQQNHRMGKRIIDTKSCVQQLLKKTFFTYKNSPNHHHNHNNNNNNKIKKDNNICDKSDKQKQNSILDMKTSYIKGVDNKKYYLKGKINKGIKVFFNPIQNQSFCDQIQNNNSRIKHQQQQNMEIKKSNTFYEENKQNNQSDKKNKTFFEEKNFVRTNSPVLSQEYSQRYQQGQEDGQQNSYIETNYPQILKTIGRGPSILMIQNLQIMSNPQLKSDSMIVLQLITHQRRLKNKKNRQRTIQTPPIIYQFFSQSSSGSPGHLKFAINISSIGDFIPMRIYKINGNQQIQMGIIDIDLSIYKYRRQMEMGENYMKEIKINNNNNGKKMERDVVIGEMKGKMRRNQLSRNLETEVKFKYRIYAKKFKELIQE